MNTQFTLNTDESLNILAQAAAKLGFEIVDIAGTLDQLDSHAGEQLTLAKTLSQNASIFADSNSVVSEAAIALDNSAQTVSADLGPTIEMVKTLGTNSQAIARWVQALSERRHEVHDALSQARKSNTQISEIALKVNTLAINAKIEAVRAGDTGRGFAVVADAINELSQQTKSAAVQISQNIAALSAWIQSLDDDVVEKLETAEALMSNASKTDAVLNRNETSVNDTAQKAAHIKQQANNVDRLVQEFTPQIQNMADTVAQTTQEIESARKRTNLLIDISERIVQTTTSMGGQTEDTVFILHVQDLAAKVSTVLQDAVQAGKLSMSQLFVRDYRPIAGTNPEQFRTAYIELFDTQLPAILEPALELDPRIVFCAPVDVNGYLPTHNRKFSHPQSDDPVWNAAHCRNRRFFDDRVGLKAGRNQDPFLLQTYRRDMGGGEFKMMKDLSAPIYINGQHWGGLRLAYAY